MRSFFLYVLLVLNGLQSGSYLLLLTSLADYFLIFTNWYLPGVLLFLLVQFGYRLLLQAPWRPMLKASALTLGASLFFYPESGLLFGLALAYGICLLMNLTFCIRHKRHSYCLFFVLLLLCDLHVGLANLEPYFTIPSGFLRTYQQRAAPGIFWIFYLPSQALLAKLLSIHRPARNLRRI